MSGQPDNFLHVYSQYMWHDDAVIRGTKTALVALREALDAAIANGEGNAEFFATDGEGYRVVICRVNTIGGVGTPEYRIQDEYLAIERAAKRRKDLALPVTWWDDHER